MNLELVKNKKLVVRRGDNSTFYYTVKEIKEKTKDYMIFIDKFDKLVYVRWIDVIEFI